jgi:hypothetical protein
MYVEMPYVGQTASSIRNKFTHLSSKLRPDLDIRYFTKPPPSVQSFFQKKDRIEKHTQPNIVYSVNCTNCEQTYVGKTDRQAIRRMKEHGAPINTYKQITTTHRDTDENQLRRSSRIRDRKTDSAQLPDKTDDKKVVLSALSKHEKDTGHRINWKYFRVVWRDENPYILLIKESLVIQAYKPALNRTTHSVPLIVFSDCLTTDLLPDPNG